MSTTQNLPASPSLQDHIIGAAERDLYAAGSQATYVAVLQALGAIRPATQAKTHTLAPSACRPTAKVLTFPGLKGTIIDARESLPSPSAGPSASRCESLLAGGPKKRSNRGV